ncbi:MAG: TerC family protein [Bernardetiaceae bacterium]
MDWSVLFSWAGLISLFTLTLLEVVLGIDNLIFISILTDKLPPQQRPAARNIGLGLALLIRIVMLFGITWIIGIKADLFNISDWIGLGLDPTSEQYEHLGISLRDLILIAGGLFLIGKSVSEMHAKITFGTDPETHAPKPSKGKAVAGVIFQIALIDIVFSFDSILTAVGLVSQISIMITAVVISMIFMLVFIGQVSDFINQNPPLKILALSFLILIGFLLATEGLGQEVSKGYVYFAMAFAFVVELINMRVRKKTEKAIKTTQPTL